MKGKKPQITWIDAENTFNKIQYPFMIKTQKTRNEKELLQHDKQHLWKTHS